MLHSKKLKTAAVLFLSVFMLNSCKKDITDAALEIESARAKSKTVLTPLQQLGKQIFFDARLSEPVGVQSCGTCHAPQVGFSGFGEIPTGGAASAQGFKRGFVAGIGEGAVAGAFGRRKPPTAAYATMSPLFSLVTVPPDPLEIALGIGPAQIFQGGLFWDGRATGLRLNSTAAEQALGPFLADKEQNHTSPAQVLGKLRNNRAYISLWQAAFGTPDINNMTAEQTAINYDRVGQAIAAYEGSPEVNQFSSKYDAYKAGRTSLTPLEEEGLRLFIAPAPGGGECYDCHTQGRLANIEPPVGDAFTTFMYFNDGIPANPNNPGGNVSPDPGLGAMLETSSNPTWKAMASLEYGKFKTPTLRNVAKAQRFMHNGVFSSLEEVVHFYNTRDLLGAGWNGVPWGSPEYPFNMDFHGVGGLGLTANQEASIVAFMKTLSDGYTGPTQ
ncbi:MAG: methylamine metabolism protein [Bacteroidota bacterium]